MAGYLVTSSAQNVGVRAVNYELRITTVSFSSTSVNVTGLRLNRNEVSTLSGGAAVDVVPLYQGAPAASATARDGTALTFSGTNKVLSTTIIGKGATTGMIGVYSYTQVDGASAQITTPMTLTVSPGSVFWVLVGLAGIVTRIFFEEIRLPGSY